MELTITGEFINELISHSKKDDKFAVALAHELVGSFEFPALAHYLLTPEKAAELLADRLRTDSERTVKELQRLPLKTQTIAIPPTRKAGRPPKATTAPTAKAGHGRGQKRHRLTDDDVRALKDDVVSFLASNPWSTRRALTAVVPLTTQSIYRRIMLELQSEGRIQAEGQKAKTLYALSGGSEVAAPAVAAAPPEAAERKRGKGSRKLPKRTK